MTDVFLGLNEINFNFVKRYCDAGKLPNFQKLLDKTPLITTRSEEKYELWEPWIQWVSIHTGRSFNEHGVFRLGDITTLENPKQIFEEIEDRGYTVGAVSPFNAANKLRNPAFFIPDPWTTTDVNGSAIIKLLYKSIRKLVNTNSVGKFSLKDALVLALAIVTYSRASGWGQYLKLAASIRKPGTKAVVLDTLLADVFISLYRKHKPDFSLLFLNSGAHIQHHYLFNSAVYDGPEINPNWYCEESFDPLLPILELYDRVIGKLLDIDEINLMVATGLSQVPHKHTTYYYRPRSHEELMKLLGIDNILKTLPLMSRDFTLDFATDEDAFQAESKLASYTVDSGEKALFSIDNRGSSLFIELSYDDEITKLTTVQSAVTGVKLIEFNQHVSFVAIKNGEHIGDGYLLLPEKAQTSIINPNVTDIKEHILSGYENTMNSST